MPVSSAAIERLFSETGIIFSAKRKRMSSKMLWAMVFAKHLNTSTVKLPDIEAVGIWWAVSKNCKCPASNPWTFSVWAVGMGMVK